MNDKKKIFFLTLCSFGFSLAITLQISNLSPILQFAGFTAQSISYLWLVAPITGLIAQPIIGLLSDNINTKMGRRRPIFLVTTLLGFIGLAFLPFTREASLIVILIILLDLGCNGNAQLSRLLVLDSTKNKQRTTALSWLSALGGLGAMCGAMLPWFIVNVIHPSEGNASAAPVYLKVTFIIGALISLSFSLITFFTTTEKPKSKISKMFDRKLSKNLSFLAKDFVSSFKELPEIFWRLCVVLFFAWIGIFSIWNYFNLFIAQNILNMPVEFTNDLSLSKKYLIDANILAAIYFGIMQVSGTFFAFAIPHLTARYSIMKIFSFGLIAGGLSLLVASSISNKYGVGLLMAVYGISWAVLTVCPYELFSKIIPAKKSGAYMGIFNFAIVFPQIVTGVFFGSFFKSFFLNTALYVIIVSGLALVISGGLIAFGFLKPKNQKALSLLMA